MEERLSRLDQMAHKVVKGTTAEGRGLDERKAEINALWDKLKVSAVKIPVILISLRLYYIFLFSCRQNLPTEKPSWTMLTFCKCFWVNPGTWYVFYCHDLLCSCVFV